MTLERASGIVLRTRLLTESSLIVHWLTAEQGRLSVAAKGARRPKSPLRGRLDLFYAAEFTFQRSRRSDLHALREVFLAETHPGLRADLPRLRQASYAALLIELATEPEAPVEGVWRLLGELLTALDARPASPPLLLAFELQLLAASGLQPDLSHGSLDARARRIAEALGNFKLGDTSRLEPTPAQVRAIAQFLHGFLIYHLGRLPRGRAEALGLGSDEPGAGLWA